MLPVDAAIACCKNKRYKGFVVTKLETRKYSMQGMLRVGVHRVWEYFLLTSH